MNRYRIIALIYAVLLFGGLLGSLFLTGLLYRGRPY